MPEAEAEATIELTAAGNDEQSAVAVGLEQVLAAAWPGSGPDSVADSAVAIRGQGLDLAAVFAELVDDLLAQLGTHGTGFDVVRLDGLLRTGDGYVGWGYLLGDPNGPAAPVDLTLVGLPEVERDDGKVTLRIRLRRG